MCSRDQRIGLHTYVCSRDQRTVSSQPLCALGPNERNINPVSPAWFYNFAFLIFVVCNISCSYSYGSNSAHLLIFLNLLLLLAVRLLIPALLVCTSSVKPNCVTFYENVGLLLLLFCSSPSMSFRNLITMHT